MLRMFWPASKMFPDYRQASDQARRHVAGRVPALAECNRELLRLLRRFIQYVGNNAQADDRAARPRIDVRIARSSNGTAQLRSSACRGIRRPLPLLPVKARCRPTQRRLAATGGGKCGGDRSRVAAASALTSAIAALAGATKSSFSLPMEPVASMAETFDPLQLALEAGFEAAGIGDRRFERFLQRRHVRADGGRNWKI